MNQTNLLPRGDARLQDPKSCNFVLPDGRKLGFAEYGLSGGNPVLFFHGAPGSSYLPADVAEIAQQCGVRLIAVDRPGYGGSDPHAGRTFLTWANDVAALTDALGITQFSIIGFSAGTPYSLACAFGFPDRIKKIGLAGTLSPGVTEGMPPMICGLYALAQTNPDELRTTFAAVAPSACALLGVATSTVADVDKQILLDQATDFELDYARALLGGVEGAASDYLLISGNLGFSLDKIGVEVHLYYGTADQNAPYAMTESIASQLPNSHIHLLQDEGHYALYRHWEDILKSVT
jgi:pimeloyl-ACP methyl ester carboxylesterase